MPNEQVKVPSAAELQRLPVWALVAFGAQLAERALQHLTQNWPNAPVEPVAALERTNELLQESARSGQAVDGLTPDRLEASLPKGWFGVTGEAEAMRSAVAGLARAARAGNVAGLAQAVSDALSYFVGRANHAGYVHDEWARADAAAKRLAEEAGRAAAKARSDAGSLSHSARDLRTAANRAALSAAGLQDRLAELQQIFEVYQALSARAKAENWDHNTPVDPETLAAVKRPEQAGHDESDPVLMLEFALDPESDDAAVNEKVARLIGHLSQLHKAYGGSGLKILKGHGEAFGAAQVLEPVVGGGAR